MTAQEIELIRQLLEKVNRLERRIGLVDTLELASGGGVYTNEEAQDAVGTILTDTATIDFTYTDATPSITADVKSDSIANTMLANMAADTIKGRANGAGTGDPTDLTATQVRTIINVASGADVTGTAITALATKTPPVDADAVVITDSAASDAPKRTTWANIKATLKTYFDTLYVDLTNAQDAVGTILTDTATIDFTYTDATPSITADVKNDSVTFAKMQNIATDSLIGRDTASSGDPENILLNATLEMDGSGNLRRAALTGDVTASAGSNATTIANDAVTNAKAANMAQNTIKGRVTASTGDPEDLTATQARAVIGAVGLTGAENVAGVKTFTDGISLGNETLTVYDEGTWTPALRFGAATTGITYTTQVGKYTRIGNRVWVHCQIVLSSKGSATGTADISGLPFTVASGLQFTSGGVVSFAAGFALATAGFSITCVAIQASTYLGMYVYSATNGTTAMPASNMLATSECIITVTYFV